MTESLKSLNWIFSSLGPDTQLWWLWLITCPLTIAWLLLASNKTKTACSSVAAGLPALFLLLAFYGLPMSFVLKVIVGIVGVVQLIFNFSWDGLLNLLVGLLGLIPVFIVLWILSVIPGVKGFVTQVLGYVNGSIKKVWDFRKHEDRRVPILGAVLFATVLCGAFATNLTTKVAFPGLIPGISAAVGLFFLVYRTVVGKKLIGKS